VSPECKNAQAAFAPRSVPSSGRTVVRRVGGSEGALLHVLGARMLEHSAFSTLQQRTCQQLLTGTVLLLCCGGG